MRRFYKEACGYLAASLLALCADVAVLAALVHYLDYPYLLAACISFGAGLLVSYALSVTWVFEYRRIKIRQVEFASFAALGMAGLVVNLLVISLCVRMLGLHYLLAKCVAALFTFACNFLLRRQLLFVPRRSLSDSVAVASIADE